MIDKENQPLNVQDEEQDLQIDEQSQLALQALLIQADRLLNGIPNNTHDLQKFHYFTVAAFDKRLKDMMSLLDNKLIKEDNTCPPSMRSNFYSLLQHQSISLLRLDRAALLNVCLQGMDIQIKPNEAIAEVISRLQKHLGQCQKLCQEKQAQIEFSLEKDTGLLSLKDLNFLKPATLRFTNSFRQLQLYIYFLFNYLRKASKALSQKNVQDLVQKMETLLPRTLTTILKLISSLKPLSNWSVCRTLQQIGTLSQQLVKLKGKWDPFKLHAFVLQVTTSQKNEGSQMMLSIWSKQLIQIANKCEVSRNISELVRAMIRHFSSLKKSLQQVSKNGMGISLSSPAGCYLVRLLCSQSLCYKQILEVAQTLIQLSSKTHQDFIFLLKALKSIDDQRLLQIKSLLSLNFRATFEEELLQTMTPVPPSETLRLIQNKLEKQAMSLQLDKLNSEQVAQLLSLLRKEQLWSRLMKLFKSQLQLLNPTLKIDFNYAENYVQSSFRTHELSPHRLLQALKVVNNGLFLFFLDSASDGFFGEFLNRPNINRALLALADKITSTSYQVPLLSHQAVRLGQQVILLLGMEYSQSNLSQMHMNKLLDKESSESKYLRVLGTINKATDFKYQQKFKQRLAKTCGKLTSKELFSHIINYSDEQSKLFQLYTTFFISKQTSLLNQNVLIGSYHCRPLNQLLSDPRLQSSQRSLQILERKTQLSADGYLVLSSDFYKFTEIQIKTNILELHNQLDNYFLTLNRRDVLGLSALLTSLPLLLLPKVQPAAHSHLKLLQALLKNYPILIFFVSNFKLNLAGIKQSLQERLKSILQDSMSTGSFMFLSQAVFQLPLLENINRILLNDVSVRFTNNMSYSPNQNNTNILHDISVAINSSSDLQTTKQLLSLLIDVLSGSSAFDYQKLSQFLKSMVNAFINISALDKAPQLQNILTLVKLFFKTTSNSDPSSFSSYFNQAAVKTLLTPVVPHTPTQSVKPFLQIKQLSQLRPTLIFQISTHSSISEPESKQFQRLAEFLPKVPNAYAQPPAKPADSAPNYQQLQRFVATKYVQSVEPLQQSLLSYLSSQELSPIYKLNPSLFLQLIPDHLRASAQSIMKKTVSPESQKTMECRWRQTKAFMLGQQLAALVLSDSQVQQLVLGFLRGKQISSYVLLRPQNFQRMFTCVLGSGCVDPSKLNSSNELCVQIQGMDRVALVKRALNFMSLFSSHTKLFYQTFQNLMKAMTPTTSRFFQLMENVTKESPFSLLLRTVLSMISENNDQTLAQLFHSFFNQFFQVLHPNQRTLQLHHSLTSNLYYSCVLSVQSINLILRHLPKLPWLKQAKSLMPKNYANMQLYMQKLGQGLKSMNLAGKIRTFNQFIQLSVKDWDEPQLIQPLSLFRENLTFYLQVLKESYRLSVHQVRESVLQKLADQFKSDSLDSPALVSALQEMKKQLQSVKGNLLMNYKSIYLSSKLRDTLIQNGKTLQYISHLPQQQLGKAIQQLQLASLMGRIYSFLLFQDDCNPHKFIHYQHRSFSWLDTQIQFSTTRRPGALLYAVTTKFDVQFDQIMQSFIHACKPLLIKATGKSWLEQLKLPPALLSSHRLRPSSVQTLKNELINQLNEESAQRMKLKVSSSQFLEDVVRSVMSADTSILRSLSFQIQSDKPLQFKDLFKQFYQQLQRILVLVEKEGRSMINPLKCSSFSLDCLTVLGKLIAVCLWNQIKVQCPLQEFLFKQILGLKIHVDQISNFEPEVWRTLKNVLIHPDSKELGLSFTFETTVEQQKQKVDLIPNGFTKKVNNLNRQEYCDAVISSIVIAKIRPQLTALLRGVFSIIPKELLSTFTLQHSTLLFTNSRPALFDSKDLVDLKLNGIILPSKSPLGKNNSRDQQVITWLLQILSKLSAEQADKLFELTGNRLAVGSGCLSLVTSAANQGCAVQAETIVLEHKQTLEDLWRDFTRLL